MTDLPFLSLLTTDAVVHSRVINSGTDKLGMDIFRNLSQSFAVRYQISFHGNMLHISGQ